MTRTSSYAPSWRYQSSVEYVVRRRFLIELAVRHNLLAPEVRKAALTFLQDGVGCPKGALKPHSMFGLPYTDPDTGELVAHYFTGPKALVNDAALVVLEDVPDRMWANDSVRDSFRNLVKALRKAGVLPPAPPPVPEEMKYKRPGGTASSKPLTAPLRPLHPRMPVNPDTANLEGLRHAKAILLSRVLTHESLSYDLRVAVSRFLESGCTDSPVHFSQVQGSKDAALVHSALYEAAQPGTPRGVTRDILSDLLNLVVEKNLL